VLRAMAIVQAEKLAITPMMPVLDAHHCPPITRSVGGGLPDGQMSVRRVSEQRASEERGLQRTAQVPADSETLSTAGEQQRGWLRNP
jgi:hypothetical protein